jgi:hypothetical protein
MIAGRAATVWERSPPASCIPTIEPGRARVSTRRTISAAPGRSQSPASTSHSTVTSPSRRATRRVRSSSNR